MQSTKMKKNSKIEGEIAAYEQKTTREKAKFGSNTVFLLFFEIKVTKFHTKKPHAFLLHFLFRPDQN